jgi:hypothetical protein
MEEAQGDLGGGLERRRQNAKDGLKNKFKFD